MEKTITAACGGGGGGGEDFLIEILVRLPAVSLLRFKSVCKSWRDLIQTSFFIHLHTATTTTFNPSSKFDTFILRTDNHSSSENANKILMLSSEYGSEYEHESEYGDGYRYRCTDGSWHKFTGGDGGDGGGGGYWLWDNINCGWCYWVSGGGGGWFWDDTNFGWYWVSDGRDWLWDATNCSWYWIGDDDDDDDKDDQEVFKADDDDDDQLLLKLTNFELPSSYNLTYSKFIAGSCNGLICLHDCILKDVSLWNPATKQFRTLPKSITIEIDDDDLVQYGMDFVAFGFDVKTKDYKVLMITKFCSKSGFPPNIFCRAQVYSLSTDSWRLFEGINSPLGPPAENYGLYLNGSCFFLASICYPESYNNNNWFINSFDFTKEIFTTMQLPPDHDDRLVLCRFGGDKMALFTTLPKTLSGEYAYNDETPDYEDCDIWVLNEHGGCGGMNEESWTKLHSFQILKHNRGFLPKGISNNGKFVLLETRDSSHRSRIQWYNLVTKEAIMDFPFWTQLKVYVYKPSLVSILGGNGAATTSPAIG